ncbi:MAG: DNA-directed RNA polymerase subunit omega [Clostridia bacterium]|nr:DNA-directed RNA polymerase subunit omega [Clostridia bacterium]
MLKPPMSDLLKKTDSAYSLVIAVAKRARQLTDGAEQLAECASDKAVSVAINEINEDKVEIFSLDDLEGYEGDKE